jgi:hypothetical protein
MDLNEFTQRFKAQLRPRLRKISGAAVRNGLLALVIAGSSGCTLFQGLSPSGSTVGTAVAQTVAAQPTSQPPAPTEAPPASPTSAPTDTPLPTETLPPTSTPEPTLTPTPTITLQPFYTATYQLYPSSTSAPIGGRYTLRVRNMNLKVTYWIGTYLPRGGNFIKPRMYIEFYTSNPATMRVYWCRYNYGDKFTESVKDDWYDYWFRDDLFTCQKRNVDVDEALVSISIQ